MRPGVRADCGGAEEGRAVGLGSCDHVSFCSDNAVLTRDGVSRVFAGEEVAATEVPVESNVVVNGKAFVAVPGDNLLSFPAKVVFVDATSGSVDAEEATKRMQKFCCCEETAKFAVELLKVGE